MNKERARIKMNKERALKKEEIAWIAYCHSGVDFEETESYEVYRAGYRSGYIARDNETCVCRMKGRYVIAGTPKHPTNCAFCGRKIVEEK